MNQLSLLEFVWYLAIAGYLLVIFAISVNILLNQRKGLNHYWKRKEEWVEWTPSYEEEDDEP